MTPADTSREAQAVQRAAWARLGGPRRVLLAFEMSEEARLISLDGLARHQPGWTDRQLVHELIWRMHGVDLRAENAGRDGRS